jgi:hypothetical protein
VARRCYPAEKSTSLLAPQFKAQELQKAQRTFKRKWETCYPKPFVAIQRLPAVDRSPPYQFSAVPDPPWVIGKPQTADIWIIWGTGHTPLQGPLNASALVPLPLPHTAADEIEPLLNSTLSWIPVLREAFRLLVLLEP